MNYDEYINICLLQESNQRYNIIDNYYQETKNIKTQINKSISYIHLDNKRKNDQTIIFCKKLIKIIYFYTKNTDFFKNNNLYIAGEWLSYLFLQKNIYDKDIIIFPKNKCNNKINEFICFLKSIDLVTHVTQFKNMYKKEYIMTTINIDNIHKNVKFYYTYPTYDSYINMFVYDYDKGLNHLYNIINHDVISSAEFINNIYNKQISFLNDNNLVLFDKWDCDERIVFANKLEEIYKFNSNNINVACFSPKFLYNESCCICCSNEEIIKGPIIQLKCTHKICLDDFKNHISYIGPQHSKCPYCRNIIDIELYEINNITEIIHKNDEEVHNDSLILYFNNE